MLKESDADGSEIVSRGVHVHVHMKAFLETY